MTDNTKKRNTRGMGSIRRKNGGYEGRITVKVNGKSKQISVFNKDKRKLLQEMTRLKQESYNEEYIEKSSITLEQWLKKWIKVYKKPFVKPRTLQGYIEKIKANILPHLGDSYIQNLTTIKLQEFFSDMTTGNKEKGIKKYSAKTIKEIKSILNMAFNDAVEINLIKKNNISSVKTPKVRRKRRKSLTPDEQKEFFMIMMQEEQGFLYLFILNTGLRPGETGGLKWKHYDYENFRVKIEDNYGKLTVYNEDFEKIYSTNETKVLKTADVIEYRYVPLQNWLNEFMKIHLNNCLKKKKLENKAKIDDDYIFTTQDGKPLSTDYLWDTLDKILKRHNFKHCSVYDLRHFFATSCVDANIPINQLKEYLGHTLGSTTMNYYVSYDEVTNQEEIKKLEQRNMEKVMPENILMEVMQVVGR